MTNHMPKIALLALSLCMMLTACGGAKSGGNAGSGKPVEIVWAMQAAANELPGWQAMVDAANEKLSAQNIKITVQKVNTDNWDEYYQKITAQMASGDVPDIGRVAEELLPNLIDKNQVVDLTDKFKEIDRSQYFEATFNNAAAKNDKIYGLPSGVYQIIMYYNKKMFDEHNLPYPSSDWAAPTAWEDIAEMAKQLTSGSGGNKIFGLAAAGDVYALASYGGKEIVFPDADYDLNDNFKRAVDIFDIMLHKDKVMPTPTDTKVMGNVDLFKAGRVGMILEGTWSHQSIRGVADFPVGIAAMPAFEGTKAQSRSFIDQFVVFKGTKHEAEAWEALKALFSEEAIDAVAATGTGGVPVNRSTLDKLQLQMIGENFSQADRDSFIQALDYTMPMPFGPKHKETQQLVNAVTDVWLNGKKDSETLLQDLEKQFSQMKNK